MHTPPSQPLSALTLGALGVVYGDIGTSPLYTMKEVFNPAHGVSLAPAHVLGATSLIFWALMLVVTLKYVILILRADNRGEGGIMALTALAANTAGRDRRRRTMLLLLGVFGAALFYGDSVITPAISVLGAVEGLKLITPAFEPYVLSICVAVLLALFLVQRHGTATVGKLFGPIIALWFVTLAFVGVVQIAQYPDILASLNPFRAWAFLHERGWGLFITMGAVVLALTGAEALYADMGHFGRKPIRIAWTTFVLPALAFNYLGQGALLLREPAALENPFYHLFHTQALVPAVLLATCASVIASQAVISGAYSMTRQAIQLGVLPRMEVRSTSERTAGQIYMPAVNGGLLVAVVLVTIGFGSASALASAYGIAVTMTMLITTLLTYFVVRYAWGYSAIVALGATGLFLFIDAVLVSACLLKFGDGGWFPLAIGIALFIVMATWKRGRERLIDVIRTDDPELVPFLSALAHDVSLRAERTAIYMVANPDTVPRALLHNLKHNQVLHRQNVICHVVFHDVPRVPESERVNVTKLPDGFWQARINFGFNETPDVPAAWPLCEPHGLHIEPMETSYFLSRETVVPTRGGDIAFWRKQLYATMWRNAGSVARFFNLPNNAVIELGARVQI